MKRELLDNVLHEVAGYLLKLTWRLGEKIVSVFASGRVELIEVLIQAA